MDTDNTALLNQILHVLLDFKSSMEQRMSRLEERVARLEERMDALEARVARLEERMDALEARVAKLEERMDALEARIDHVEASLGERINQVEASLNDRIDHVEASLSERINQVEVSLNERIDHVEASLENQQNAIVCIKEILELDIRSNVSIVAENHDFLNRKLNQIMVQLESNEAVSLRVNYLDMEVRKIKTHLKLA